MKRQNLGEREEFGNILPEYGRRKLLTYADSIRELADSFRDTRVERTSGQEKEVQDRRDYIWQKRLCENKELMVAHLEEMAQIMSELARETRRCVPMGERRFKQIAHALREVDIQIKNLYLIENEMGHMEVSLTMRNMKTANLSAEEIGDLLSVLLNMHLVSAGDTIEIREKSREVSCSYGDCQGGKGNREDFRG